MSMQAYPRDQQVEDEFMAVDHFGGKKRGRDSDYDDTRSPKKPHAESNNPNSFMDSMGTPMIGTPFSMMTPGGDDFYRSLPQTPLTPLPIVAHQGHPDELAAPSRGHIGQDLDMNQSAFSRTGSFSNFQHSLTYSENGFGNSSQFGGGSSNNSSGSIRASSDNGSVSTPGTENHHDQSFGNNSSSRRQFDHAQASTSSSESAIPPPSPSSHVVQSSVQTPRLPPGVPSIWQGDGPPPPPPQGFMYVTEAAYNETNGNPLIVNGPQGYVVVPAQPQSRQQQDPQQQQQQQHISQQQSHFGGQNNYPQQLQQSQPPLYMTPYTAGYGANSQYQPPPYQNQPYSPHIPRTPNQFAQPFIGNSQQSYPTPPQNQSYNFSSQNAPKPQTPKSYQAPSQPFSPGNRPITPKNAPQQPFPAGNKPPTPKTSPQQPFAQPNQPTLMNSNPNFSVRREQQPLPPHHSYPPTAISQLPTPYYESNPNFYQTPYPQPGFASNNPQYRPQDFRDPPQGFPQQQQPQPRMGQQPLNFDMGSQQMMEPPQAPKTPESVMHQRLGLSKSPVLDALVYCALNHWGLKFVDDRVPNPDERIMFEVDNFELFLRCATDINSKNKQTSDTASRIKALRRWFDGIPNLRSQNETFTMVAKKDEVKNDKLRKIVERMAECYTERSEQLKLATDRAKKGAMKSSNESEDKSGDLVRSSITTSSPRYVDSGHAMSSSNNGIKKKYSNQVMNGYGGHSGSSEGGSSDGKEVIKAEDLEDVV